MAKGARGGKRSGGSVADNQKVKQAAAAKSMSTDFNDFLKMSDDQKADVISKMTKQGVPAHLSDTDFQKFIYNIGLNDKPEVVSDNKFNTMSGKTLYRTINMVYDKPNDISYTAVQIAKQIQTGRITRTSDNGGSFYGRGLYFDQSKAGSTLYGKHYGNVKKTSQIKAKLNSKANIIGYNKCWQGVQNEINSGSKLGKSLKSLDSDSQTSIYALSKGYNVVVATNGYHCVLNRQALTLSDAIDPI